MKPLVAGADGRSGHLDCTNGRIRRSPSPSCIIRPTGGPVRPVVPGDRRLEVLVHRKRIQDAFLAGLLQTGAYCFQLAGGPAAA